MAATPFNNQFQIPSNFAETPVEVPVVEVPLAATPEAAPSPTQALLDSEMHIFAARNKALAASAQKTNANWLRAATLRRPQQATMQDLVNKESHLGGKIGNPKGNDLFWLDAQSESFQHTGVADWYFAKPTATPNVYDTIWFQATPTSIHKIYKGLEVPLSNEEQLALIETAAVYENTVLGLYSDYELAA